MKIENETKEKVFIKKRTIHFSVHSYKGRKICVIRSISEKGLTKNGATKSRTCWVMGTMEWNPWTIDVAGSELFSGIDTLRERKGKNIVRDLKKVMLKSKFKKKTAKKKGANPKVVAENPKINAKIITDIISDLVHTPHFLPADFNMDVCIARKKLENMGANQEQMKFFESGVVSALDKKYWPANRENRGNGM